MEESVTLSKSICSHKMRNTPSEITKYKNKRINASNEIKPL